jgi:hypothetical protein
MTVRRVLLCALVLLGCDAPSPPPSTPVSSAAVEPTTPVAASEPTNAPASTDAAITDVQRRDAVLALFAGDVDVGALPLHDVDPGTEFDPGLRDRIAPPASSGRVPRVRQEKATVTGALDKDIIRRIVRAHINEIRYCYNQVLVLDPHAGGRVELEFEIAKDGTVSRSTVKSSTVDDKAVAECMAKAVLRWKFPKPTEKSSVAVIYPFVLEAG